MTVVINLHVTEACNMRCTYCFAKWEHGIGNIFETPASRHQLIRTLYDFFSRRGVVRFNFVGGEPAMLRGLEDALKECRGVGALVSLVTNGLLFSRMSASAIANHLHMIGLSLDSENKNTLQKIGRVYGRNTVQDPKGIVEGIEMIRQHNSDIEIKVNTVVSEANWTESMHSIIRIIRRSRWKVFRVLPVFNTIKPITDQQYWRFLEAHCEFQSIMVAEDNSDMLESYIMVNPSGCFFQNVILGGGYLYSAPILSVGAERAFQVMGFDEHKFSRRYLRESHSDEA